jgi:hypothetical protein
MYLLGPLDDMVGHRLGLLFEPVVGPDDGEPGLRLRKYR